jgi:cytochrome c oxidase cbb3-type subunit 2
MTQDESNRLLSLMLSGFPAAAARIDSVALKAMQTLGVPYTDEDIAGAGDAVKGKTEMDALVAYLQGLGTSLKNKR